MALTKRLVATLTLVSSLLLTMDHDMTTILLSAGVTAHIRAKLCLRVQLASPLLS